MLCLSRKILTHRRARWKEILIRTPAGATGYSMKALKVEYNTTFHRRENGAIRDQVNATWDEIQRKASWVNRPVPYDTPKFRLAGVFCGSRTLKLKIGLTSYKEYMAFRTSAFLRRQARTIAKSMNLPVDNYMPKALGNVAVVLTKDLQTVAVRRSRSVSTYMGYFDLPGGHPEPNHVCGLLQNERDSLTTNHLILDELYGSIRREVAEDLSIPPSTIGAPHFLTILINLRDIGTPDMVFLLPVDLSVTELCHLFQKGISKYAETTSIITFDPFKRHGASAFRPQTPIMEGALSITRAMGLNITRGL